MSNGLRISPALVLPIDAVTQTAIPISTSSFVTVLIETSAIRLVARKLLPSTSI